MVSVSSTTNSNGMFMEGVDHGTLLIEVRGHHVFDRVFAGWCENGV